MDKLGLILAQARDVEAGLPDFPKMASQLPDFPEIASRLPDFQRC